MEKRFVDSLFKQEINHTKKIKNMQTINKCLALAVGALCLTALPSCESEEHNSKNDDNPRTSISLSPAQTRACEAGNEFGVKLLRKAAELSEKDNIALSPVTVSMNLSMAANGAKDGTLTKLLNLLEVESLDDLNSYYSHMLATLPTMDKMVDMYFANSLWLDETLTPSPDYLSAIGENFQAAYYPFTVGSEDAWREINSWCERNTGGLIRDFLDTPPFSRVSLISTTAFNGKWSIFDRDRSQEGTFTNHSGDTSTVTMMSTSDTYHAVCGWGDDWKGVKLPYGNASFNLTVILPDEGKTVGEVLRHIDSRDVTFADNSERRCLLVKMPRFEVRSKGSLSGELAAMGFHIGDSDNDFSGICGDRIPLSDLRQETVITSNEEGTTAASAALADGLLEVFGDSTEFIIDRPFIFFISEESTGAILYAGVVNQL